MNGSIVHSVKKKSYFEVTFPYCFCSLFDVRHRSFHISVNASTNEFLRNARWVLPNVSSWRAYVHTFQVYSPLFVHVTLFYFIIIIFSKKIIFVSFGQACAWRYSGFYGLEIRIVRVTVYRRGGEPELANLSTPGRKIFNRLLRIVSSKRAVPSRIKLRSTNLISPLLPFSARLHLEWMMLISLLCLLAHTIAEIWEVVFICISAR